MAGNYAILPEIDYARGHFGEPYLQLDGQATHTRAIVYLRDIGWVVIDLVGSDRPRTIEALWHFHPDCNVAVQGLSATSMDQDEGNVRIVPVGSMNWEVKLVKGQTEPRIEGWYSPEYNIKQPNSTAVYRGRTAGDITFAWLLIPAKGLVPAVEAEFLPAPEGGVRVHFALAEDNRFEVAARMQGTEPIPLSSGLVLDGDCAVLRSREKPVVVGGRIIDSEGRVRANHRYGE
jgi:hypothetical protein